MMAWFSLNAQGPTSHAVSTPPSRPLTTSDVAALYARLPSFTDHLPWVEYLPESRCFLLEDGVSVGALVGLDFVLSIALPGYEPSDIELMVTPREIIVHARREAATKEDGREGAAQVRCSDFRSDDVYRRFEFPQRVDVAQVGATLRLGILTVRLPKSEAAVTTIPIAEAA